MTITMLPIADADCRCRLPIADCRLPMMPMMPIADAADDADADAADADATDADADAAEDPVAGRDI